MTAILGAPLVAFGLWLACQRRLTERGVRVATASLVLGGALLAATIAMIPPGWWL